MPTIPEEMDEFVNWDKAGPVTAATGSATIASPSFALLDPILDRDHDLELALENVDGDDFSFWALQHYENSHMVTMDPALETGLSLDNSPKAFDESFELPEAPCAHCQAGGYQCKLIREGKYKGYCTSCVALRCGCSFGLAGPTPYPTDSAFPHNPWPVMGDHPDAITQEDARFELLPTTSLSEPASLNSAAAAAADAAANNGGRKSGARFSRESVKILKNWLSTHSKHPYPNDEEKKMLQKQTGLDKTQITNWLANARRRKKIVAPRSTSPGVRTWANAIDIPQRHGTPASFEHMNPLQRWQNSPPENEPASVTAIARAVTASTASNLSSPGLNSPFSLNFTDDGSGRSLCNVSSVSSIDRSISSASGSFASAFSHVSRGSMGSFGSLDRGRRRRRRKVANRKSNEAGIPPASAALKSFQCTFCTETFRTKHDWQRHEKSLHLSLERWVCTPDGPRAFNPENGQVSCVFCGEAHPGEAHVENHNHSACQERTLSERTFYRKDHLRQHLKLVHGVKFASWSMEQWKVATPEIRSRCGFCGIVMDTWTIRVDHLAEHFKTGKTMADWKGDWGFDAPVADMVENGIPPYLIHDERNSPYPYEATQGPPDTARNAYELIKSELLFYLTNELQEKGYAPTDQELQVEACRIVFGAEVLSRSEKPSWLRDLLLSSNDHTMKARLAPIRSQVDSRQSRLKINGKDNIFDEDVMEAELHEYVKARRLLGLTAMDQELQIEACNIIGRMEESSSHPSEDIANFMLRLIFNSSKWLAAFRNRALLPRSEDVEDEASRSKDPATIDSTIHNYSRLESELADYVRAQRSLGMKPSDADLQRQARLIIYEIDDDGWNQTAADNAVWLSAFRQRHMSSESNAAALASNQHLTIQFVTNGPFGMLSQPSSAPTDRPKVGSGSARSFNSGSGQGSSSGSATATAACGFDNFKAMKTVGPYFFNDANCYRRLARELSRWCSATMSPNNPNCHIPTDEELQHQARWILYEDDDPWNQTAADNAEWLRRFKRQVGILTDPSLPGLPEGLQWNITQGGSGFAPPYVFPNPNVPIAPVKDDSITIIQGGKPIQAESATATKYLQTFTVRHEPPALVFCSRELETGLVKFVEEQVSLSLGLGGGTVAAQTAFPGDEDIKAKAREILKTANTAVDDEVLLEKFKGMMKERMGFVSAGHQTLQIPSTTSEFQVGGSSGAGLSGAGLDLLAPSNMDFNMDLGMTDKEVNDILNDIDFDFGDILGLPSPGDAGTMTGLNQA